MKFDIRQVNETKKEEHNLKFQKEFALKIAKHIVCVMTHF